jgi:hypothetical protein
VVDTPTDPIPPARASGEIRRNGTAVVITFAVCSSCPKVLLINKINPTINANPILLFLIQKMGLMIS